MMGVRLDQERPGHWSTDGVDQRRALAYWVDTVCDRFLELDIDTPVRSNFRACLDQIDFGPATLSFVGAASQRIRRTPAQAFHAHAIRRFSCSSSGSGTACCANAAAKCGRTPANAC